MNCTMLDLVADGEKTRSQRVFFGSHHGGEKNGAHAVVDAEARFIPAVEV